VILLQLRLLECDTVFTLSVVSDVEKVHFLCWCTLLYTIDYLAVNTIRESEIIATHARTPVGLLP